MSFFGFDAALPRDKQRSEGRSTFDPTGGFDNDESLDAKIKALAASAQEDVEIYTWGQEGYDGLGDKLDESGDDLNDDTFGDVNVAKDFDFGNGAAATKVQPQRQPNQYHQPAPPSVAAAPRSKFDSSNKFGASLDDFLVDPSPRFGATRTAQPPAQTAPRGQPKTLEQIEAEMLAMRNRAPSQPNVASVEKAPLTVEQIEAEMRAKRGAPPPSQQQQQQQPEQAVNPSFAAIMQSQQRDRARPAPSSPAPQMASVGPQPNDPAAMQAAHFARMRALLEAMPPLVQQSILSLPPPMQFDSLENVVQNFPNLLDPAQREANRPSPAEQDAVRFLMEKAQVQIAEVERVEAKRKRRMDKINAMAKYNGVMSGSDKDFITRIQISQLITPDPYTDDFYAHIFFALRGGPPRPGMPLSMPQPNQKQGKGKQKLNKQQNAMLRMQQQVERIVQSRKERSEKSASGIALEGALGRVSLSSTKNPRQMLQISGDNKAGEQLVSSTPDAGHARDAVRQALGAASLGNTTGNDASVRRDPLTRHEVLRILEKLYDLVLQLEQMRRNVPAAPEDVVDPKDEAASAAKAEYDAYQQEQSAITSQLWTELRVLEPLEISDPHPFVSLLSSAKGKRFLPRALRHLTAEQTLTALTMVVASFESLDVVQNGPLLDDLAVDDPRKVEARRDAERQSETFATTIVPSMMQMASTAPMRIVSGMLALFVERNDPVRVAQTRPGVAFLTIFLSRAETLRQQTPADIPADELEQFQQIFGLLFSRLTAQGKLVTLFPSTRTKQSLPFGVSYYMGAGLGQQLSAQTTAGAYRNVDLEDEPSWNLMAALAIGANMHQQQILVQELREKILENVISANEAQKRNPLHRFNDDTAPDIRIRNVNLLLHALNLDAAQISV